MALPALAPCPAVFVEHPRQKMLLLLEPEPSLALAVVVQGSLTDRWEKPCWFWAWTVLRIEQQLELRAGLQLFVEHAVPVWHLQLLL